MQRSGRILHTCRRTLGLVLVALIAGSPLLLSAGSPKKIDDKKTGTKKTDGKVEHGFVKRALDGAKYQVFIPYSYKGEKPYPTILFLQGSTGSGNDGEKMMYGGLPFWVKDHAKTFPFITVFPQAHSVNDSGAWGFNTPDGKRAMAILAEVEKHYKVDPARIYLTGYSIGGHGTWSLAAAYPDKWAAIAPVAAWGPFDPFTYGKPPTGLPDADSVKKIKDLPCWCFYAEGDKGVMPAYVEHMLEALKKAGGNPKITHYGKDIDHGSIVNHAYQTAGLYPWFLGHKK